MPVPSSDASEKVLGYFGELTQFLTGSVLGIFLGAVLGFLISELIKHRLKKDQLQFKLKLDKALEDHKKDLVAQIETLRKGLSVEIEEVKDTIKVASTYKIGIASELSKQGGGALIELLAGHYECERLLTYMVASMDVDPRLSDDIALNFIKHHLDLVEKLGSASALLPEGVINNFIPWCHLLGTTKDTLKAQVAQGGVAAARAALQDYKTTRSAWETEIRRSIQNPS